MISLARDRQRGREKLKDPGRSLSRAVSIFYISAFCLLFLRDCQWQALALAVAVPLAGAFTTGFLPRLFPVDKLLLSLTNFLCALGLLVLYDTNPTYAYHQSIYYFVGLAAMVVCIYLIRVGRNFRLLVWPMMLLSLVLLVLPLFIGKETYGAKNWFYVGGISVQPSEIVKLTLIIVISRFMADRRLIPWLGFSVACLGVLMLQADLGTALLYYGVALMLYFASSGNPVLMLCGIGGGVGAALLGYQKFAHVKKRVAIWLDPWSELSAHSEPDGNRQRRRVRRRLGTGQPDDDSRLPHGLHLLRHLRAVRDAVRLVRAADVCCHHLARHIHRNGGAHPLPRAAGHGLHRHAWLADVHHHRRGD